MYKASQQEIVHFLGDGSRFDKLLARYFHRVDDSDRSTGTALLIADVGVTCGYTDIGAEESRCNGLGRVPCNVIVVEQPLEYIDYMGGVAEMLLNLETFAMRRNYGNIVPAVDVDLLDMRVAEILRQQRIFSHFRVELIGNLFQYHVGDIVIVILHVLLNELFHQLPVVGTVQINGIFR